MGRHSFGPVEMGIVAFIIMLIFGVGRLPEVGGAMGKAIRGSAAAFPVTTRTWQRRRQRWPSLPGVLEETGDLSA